MFKNPTLEFVKKFWIFSIFYVEMGESCCGAFTIVYAYSNLTNNENAVLHIIAGLMALAVYTFGKAKKIRRWIIRNYTLMAVIGIIVDAGTELMLLKSPFIKLICDVVALGAFFKFYRIQMVERSNAIFDDEERVQFDLDYNRGCAAGVVTGGITALVAPPIDIQIIIWISAVWISTTYITSWIRFKIIDNYMHNHGLVCACMKDKK